jgi:hypothetical protein
MTEYYSYVAGVHDTLDALGIVCASTSVSVGQVSAVVAKFVKENPERWDEPAVGLVSDALIKAFPCKAK